MSAHRRRSLRVFATATALWLAQGGGAHAAPEVVASIKPVHSLVAGVMRGIATPGLIVDGTASPHTFNLRPSTVRALADTDLVFWVGPQMESFLARKLPIMRPDARAVALIDTPGLVRLRFGDDYGHDEHGHADDDKDPDHDGDREHEHDKAHDEDHRGTDEHGHAATDIDGHIWLEPTNARLMVGAIAEALIAADPENAAAYAANAEDMTLRIAELTAEIGAALAPVRRRPYVAFHAAYGYFESHFGLNPAGAITLSPEVGPSAERLRTIRNRMRNIGVACVFSEPQFDTRFASVVTEGTLARTATLDPLGAQLGAGPGLYFDLMRNMAASMRACLSHDG
jgi:zinc transport system substrate-binding protein